MPIPHYLGTNALSAELKIGKYAAILLALNEGLHVLGKVSDDEYKLLDQRYRRPLQKIIDENRVRRENSHVQVVTLEKEKRLLASKDHQFKGMLAQWAQHKDLQWRSRALADAEKYKDKLSSAKALLTQHRQGRSAI